MMRPALAVSLGDPAGVGPELICAAWVRRETDALRPFFAVGGANLLAAAARQRALIGHDIPGQIAKAGRRLDLHPVPADFAAWRERTLARGAA